MTVGASGFAEHWPQCFFFGCVKGEQSCCICMRMVPHEEWWMLRDDRLDSKALVCPEDAALYADKIPIAVETIQARWAKAGANW